MLCTSHYPSKRIIRRYWKAVTKKYDLIPNGRGHSQRSLLNHQRKRWQAMRYWNYSICHSQWGDLHNDLCTRSISCYIHSLYKLTNTQATFQLKLEMVGVVMDYFLTDCHTILWAVEEPEEELRREALDAIHSSNRNVRAAARHNNKLLVKSRSGASNQEGEDNCSRGMIG